MRRGEGLYVLPVYDAFLDCRARYALLYGGAGSGKSYAAAQKVLLRCLEEPGLRVLVVRKTARTLRRSVFALLRQLIAEAGLQGLATVRSSENNLWIGFPNGSEILFSGCQDADKLKSIQGISTIWVEEATELEAHDFDQLELRVRGETAGYKQFVLTFNPVDMGGWVYGRFFDRSTQPPLHATPSAALRGGEKVEVGGLIQHSNESNHPGPAKAGPPLRSLPSHRSARESVGKEGSLGARDNVFVLRTTYKDNERLDEAYRKHLEETLRRDGNLYRIYALGQWGHLKRGGEFYKHFDMAKHVQPAAYKKHLPLHISFDFNLNPYMTLTVWQAEGSVLRQIDEICLTNPDNSTPALCARFLEKYGRHQAGLNIYGDPTGARGNTQTTARTSDYGVIMQALKEMHPDRKVRAAAPEVALRGRFINRLLMGQVEGLRVQIDPRCTNTIQDYQNLQEHADGSKVKEMHTDRNGVRCQKYGHCSDANDYLLCRVFEPEFRRYTRKGGILPPALIQPYRYGDG